MLYLHRPVRTIRIHDFLKSKLCDLYENDCIFDKFECSLSGTGEYVLASLSRSFGAVSLIPFFLRSHLLTGSYHNYFHIYDIQSPRTNALRMKLGRGPSKKSEMELNADDIDFNKKVLFSRLTDDSAE